MDLVDNPRLGAWLYLLLIDALAIYVFYFAFLDVLTSLGAWNTSWKTTTTDLLQLQNVTMRLGDINYCFLNDYWTAAFVPPFSVFRGECVDLEVNWTAMVNLGCIMLCACEIIFTGTRTLGNGGADVCSGRFLSRRISASSSPGYKLFAGLLAAYIPLILLVAFYHEGCFDLGVKWHVDMMCSFAFYKITPVVVTTLSAASLVYPTRPRFDTESEAFHELRFHRTWVDLMFQPTSNFVKTLEQAAVMARLGNTRPLLRLLESPDQLQQAMDACQMQLGDDESDSEEEATDISVANIEGLEKRALRAKKLITEDLA